MSPPPLPPRASLHLAPGPHTDDVEELPWTLDMVGRVAKSTASKVATLSKDFDKTATVQAQATKALHEEIVFARQEIEVIHGGVLEAIEIGRRVEKRQQDDATALRQSDAMLDHRTGDHSAQIAALQSILKPIVAEAAREGSRQGSARATKAMGAVGGAVAVAIGLVQHADAIIGIFGKASAPVAVGVVVVLALSLWLTHRRRVAGSIPPPPSKG